MLSGHKRNTMLKRLTVMLLALAMMLASALPADMASAESDLSAEGR